MRIRSLVLLPLLVSPGLAAFGGSTAGYQHKQKTPTRMREGSMIGGARRDRTADLNTASVALSQLSYGPSTAAYIKDPPYGRQPLKHTFFQFSEHPCSSRLLIHQSG